MLIEMITGMINAANFNQTEIANIVLSVTKTNDVESAIKVLAESDKIDITTVGISQAVTKIAQAKETEPEKAKVIAIALFNALQQVIPTDILLSHVEANILTKTPPNEYEGVKSIFSIFRQNITN